MMNRRRVQHMAKQGGGREGKRIGRGGEEEGKWKGKKEKEASGKKRPTWTISLSSCWSCTGSKGA